MLQENEKKVITKEHIFNFLEDCKEIGVKGISLVGDGESSQSPIFIDTIVKGGQLGLDIACASNALVINKNKAEIILPHMTYLRVNFSGGEKKDMQKSWGLKNLGLIEFVKI